MSSINNYRTAEEAATELNVQYYTLLSWIKKDVCKIKTDGLTIKKSGWLIHKTAVTRLHTAIEKGEISSKENS